MNWIADRLLEASTWRGLVWVLTACGLILDPEQSEAIIVAGMAFAGLLGVFLKDWQTRREMRRRETDLLPGEQPTVQAPSVVIADSIVVNETTSATEPTTPPGWNKF